MDKQKFKEQLQDAPDDINAMKIGEIIRQSFRKVEDDRNGIYNLIIAMEEFSELSTQITKYIRKKCSRNEMLEELADAQLSIWYIQQICGISNDELNKAINVKATNQQERNEKGEKF